MFSSEANKIVQTLQPASSRNLIVQDSEENDNNDSRWQQSHSLLYFFPSATDEAHGKNKIDIPQTPEIADKQANFDAELE